MAKVKMIRRLVKSVVSKKKLKPDDVGNCAETDSAKSSASEVSAEKEAAAQQPEENKQRFRQKLHINEVNESGEVLAEYVISGEDSMASSNTSTVYVVEKQLLPVSRSMELTAKAKDTTSAAQQQRWLDLVNEEVSKRWEEEISKEIDSYFNDDATTGTGASETTGSKRESTTTAISKRASSNISSSKQTSSLEEKRVPSVISKRDSSTLDSKRTSSMNSKRASSFNSSKRAPSINSKRAPSINSKKAPSLRSSNRSPSVSSKNKRSNSVSSKKRSNSVSSSKRTNSNKEKAKSIPAESTTSSSILAPESLRQIVVKARKGDNNSDTKRSSDYGDDGLSVDTLRFMYDRVCQPKYLQDEAYYNDLRDDESKTSRVSALTFMDDAGCCM